MLRAAADVGSASLVRALLLINVSVFETDAAAKTAAHFAAASGHEEVCRLLHRAGADGSAEDAERNSVTNLARINHHAAVIRIFSPSASDLDASEASNGSAFLHACFVGDAERVGAALSAGTDANGVAENGVSPLMLASRAGHEKVVLALLDADARIDCESHRGCTALSVAAEGNALRSIELLLVAGAPIEHGDGTSPLWRAAESGHAEAVNLLIQHKASIEVTNDEEVMRRRSALL